MKKVQAHCAPTITVNIIDKNKAVLVGMIEDIFIKLDKKNSSFKRVALNEFNNFLRVLGVEKQKFFKNI